MCVSLLRSWLPATIGLSLLFPMAAGAARIENGSDPASTPLAGFVQLASLDEIESPGDRRRVSFYADKVLAAMAGLAEDDIRITSGEGDPDPDVLEEFRNAMLRFVNAAEAAGLKPDGISTVLADAFAERYEGPEPIQLLDSDGNLEANSLVSTSMGFQRFGDAAGKKREIDYLSAIAVEGSKTREERLTRLSETGEAPEELEVAAAPQTIEEEPVEEVEDVVEEVDPVIASIRERVVFDGTDRVLRIQRGDTLGLIARALYGDSLLYRNIYSYNRDRMSNPDSLRVGLELRLPEL